MNFYKRSKSRELILQIIYCSKISKHKNIKRIINHFKLINNKLIKKIDKKYFFKLIKGIKKNENKIKNILKKNIKKNTRLNLIDKIILKLSIYEILYNKHLSHKIIINESIKLTKKFSSINSYKLINKILDTIFTKYKK